MDTSGEKAKEIVAAFCSQQATKKIVRDLVRQNVDKSVHDVQAEGIASALREADRKAREDCARIAHIHGGFACGCERAIRATIKGEKP